MTARPTVLTAGETMALMDPFEDGTPGLGSRFVVRIAGAETNYGIGLSRLGIPVRWISKVGDDPWGEMVVDTLHGEGIDLGYVQKERNAATGLFFKWRRAGKSYVLYYRNGSAASLLGPGDVPDDALEGVAHMHLTGITMAISETAGKLVLDLAQRASKRGITVSFDPNYRPALWTSPKAALDAQLPVLQFVDWYLCGLEEGQLLFGVDGEQRLEDSVRDAGARNLAVRVGERGAVVRDGGGLVTVPPVMLETVLDEIGAGDGFAAGFTYGLLKRWPPPDCARAGNLIAAAALRGTGDWETLPYLGEVQSDMEAIATTDWSQA